MSLSHGQGHAHSKIDKVIGLELFLAHRSVALRCDTCGAMFGERDGYRNSSEIRRDARAAGWTGPLTHESNTDRCPACAAKG